MANFCTMKGKNMKTSCTPCGLFLEDFIRAKPLIRSYKTYYLKGYQKIKDLINLFDADFILADSSGSINNSCPNCQSFRKDYSQVKPLLKQCKKNYLATFQTILKLEDVLGHRHFQRKKDKCEKKRSLSKETEPESTNQVDPGAGTSKDVNMTKEMEPESTHQVDSGAGTSQDVNADSDIECIDLTSVLIELSDDEMDPESAARQHVTMKKVRLRRRNKADVNMNIDVRPPPLLGDQETNLDKEELVHTHGTPVVFDMSNVFVASNKEIRKGLPKPHSSSGMNLDCDIICLSDDESGSSKTCSQNNTFEKDLDTSDGNERSDFVIHSVTSLSNAQETTHDSPRYLCDTNGHSALHEHEAIVSDNLKKFQCYHCRYRSERKPSLLAHIRTKHLKKKDLYCPCCRFSAAQYGDLKHHVCKRHPHVEVLQCTHCVFAGFSRKQMARHARNIHKCHSVRFLKSQKTSN